jgi:hypothetical protein
LHIYDNVCRALPNSDVHHSSVGAELYSIS